MTVPLGAALALERSPRHRPAAKPPEPVASPPHPLVRLQRQAGNGAVTRLVQRLQDGALQRNGEEDELALKRDLSVQRQTPEEEELVQGDHDEDARQGAVGLDGGALPSAAVARIDSLRGAGSTLNHGVRAAAENTLGMELSGVRVHQDSASDSLARSMTAKAFTSGNDVFLRGDMNPNDSRLIGHELTHVVQQSSGEPAPAGQRMTVGPADDPLENEADSVADAISNGSTANREMEDR